MGDTDDAATINPGNRASALEPGSGFRFFSVPWRIRLPDRRVIPAGLYPTNDQELAKTLAKCVGVKELSGDSPEVAAAVAVKATEQAGAGRVAAKLDRQVPDWRAKASASAATNAIRRTKAQEATAKQRELSRKAEAEAKAAAEAEAKAREQPAEPSASPAPALAAQPDGLVPPGASGAVLEASGAVFSPAAAKAGEAPAGEPEASTATSTRETMTVGADEVADAAAVLGQDGTPEAKAATGTTGEAEKPGERFDFMTKAQLRTHLTERGVHMGANATITELRKLAKLDAGITS